MDTTLKDEKAFDKDEKYFYYHPFYTTLAFIFPLIYILAFGAILYLCWTTNRTTLLFGFLAAFILLSNPFLLIATAFLRLLFNKPAIVLTETHFFDFWNNIKLDWKDIKQINSFSFRWAFICINTTTDKAVFRQILNPSKFLFMGFERLLSGKSLKINLSLLKDRNEYIVSTTKYFWRTKTATNMGFGDMAADE